MRDHNDDELPLAGRKPVDEDVQRELDFHFQERVRELEAKGLSNAEALKAATVAFGDRRPVEAECRTIEQKRRAMAQRANRLDALRHDLVVGFRLLRKNPGFTIAAVLTLALGIGANTAVFSIVNTLVLQPLSYDHPEQLVRIEELHGNGGASAVPWPNFLDFQAQSKTFTAMASFNAGIETVLGAGSPARIHSAGISAGFFSVFPLRPALGRLPATDEYRLGTNAVAVVSYEFWRSALGAPQSLSGVHIKMETDYDVIGVLPPGFEYPDRTQVWTPLEREPQWPSRTSHNNDVIGRLKPGATSVAATRDLDGIIVGLRKLYAPNFDAAGMLITPLQQAMTASVRTPLYLLLGASTLLLLAACTNLASSMLARGTARHGEFAVRSALGATRIRIVRQLLTEAGMIAVLGCAAGLLLAELLLRSLTALAPASLALSRVHADGWVLTFAIAVATMTAVLFGLLPAWRLSDTNTATAMRDGSRGTAGARRMRVWYVLVATEVALAVVLLTGSTLLIRSFSRVMDVPLGFDPANTATVAVNLPAVNYGDSLSDIPAFHERVLAALRQQPGIAAAGFANVLPLAGNFPGGVMIVEGKPFLPEGPFTGYSVYRVVGGDYFAAMGIKLLRGRTFNSGDDAAGPPVTIVSQMFADKEWPGENPIGKRVSVYGMDRSTEVMRTVVGVVADVRGRGVTGDIRETYYFDHRQRQPGRSRSVTYAVRSTLNPAMTGATVRRVINSIDPQVPVELSTMNAVLNRSVADKRFVATVLTAFASIALILAIVGIYGVVSYSVAQRTREIGVRLALGAETGAVRGMIQRAAMGAVVPGLLIGALAAMAGARALTSMLYEISPFDPGTFVVSLAVLGVGAWLSSLIPAMRATRVDPIVAMRSE
jgi:putative ABC transport system permease protein